MLIDAERRLSEVRKTAEAESKRARQTLPALRALLAEQSDERARQAIDAVTQVPPDLGQIEQLAVGADAGDDEITARLRQIAAITLPPRDDADQAVADLAKASDRVVRLAGTAAGDARRLAGLLTTALEHQRAHPGELCPVCGGRPLDDAWAAATGAEVTRLSAAAETADTAHADLDVATTAVRNLAGAMPLVLHEGLDLGGEVDSGPARLAWRTWAERAAAGSVARLLSEAPALIAALTDTSGAMQADAADALERRSQAWQPAAAALAGWADQARSSQRAAGTLADARKAIAWFREIDNEIRNARLAPFADKSAMVWELLKQESNVELGPIRLEGTATHRRVSLDVTVDGIAGAALSVMSQGELHALGLSLFLPRATAADSPFRFVMIDDPVQSMDPAKVDGLARLLAQVASDRQVVVFTHDDRLPEAIRRLGLAATIWEVTRREHSVVELTKNDDPVHGYLDDARSLALTSQLPKEARAVVVAGYCRSAVEAACHRVVRARRIMAGARHSDVERDLEQAQKLYEVAALALFDDAGKGSQVLNRLRQLGGQAIVDAFAAINAGTHDAYKGDLKHLVSETERLIKALRR